MILNADEEVAQPAVVYRREHEVQEVTDFSDPGGNSGQVKKPGMPYAAQYRGEADGPQQAAGVALLDSADVMGG